MKKTYLFLLMVFLAIGSGSLFAQQRVLDEGFETTAAGALPTGWTQEPADAAAKWTVEKDNGSLSHPASCATGTGRIKLKATGASDEVLLISPAFDNTRLAASILVFDYAAIRPNGGVADSLKVYYRLASNRPWTLVKSYGEADTWTRDTIDITQRYATFQIAFGVAAKDGALGVALDNIHFSSRPICTAVTDVEVYNKIHTEAKIRWSGSLSADYNVVISTKELVVDPASAVDGVLLSKKVSGATNIHISQSATQTTLEPSTQYWYYIQSDCGYGDVAAWVSGSFTTACPPVEGFNTSFEAESGEFDCWTTIGEDHGVVIATRPNIKIDSVMTGVQNDGTPSFRTLDHLMKPHTGSAALWMPIYSRTNYTEDFSRVYAVSPRLVDGVNLKEMQLSFWLRTNNKSLRLRVIVSE